MRNIALTLISLFTVCLGSEVTAQSQTRKVTTVTKSSIDKQRTQTNLTKEEQVIAEINARLNVIDEAEEKTSKSAESRAYCYITEQLLNVANDYRGVRYRWGGMSRNGMDCSGFVKTAFDQFSIGLPRTSREMASRGEKISKSEAKPGDLIFFKNGGSRVINHVGIIIEVNEDEIKFIHSATSSGVSINSTKEPYYSRGFVQINRVYDRQVL